MTMKTFYIGVVRGSDEYELTEAFKRDFEDFFPADVLDEKSDIEAGNRVLKITVEEVTE